MKLMTTAEVADLVRRPPATLRYWRHINEGPPSFRLQGRVVYREDAVLTWIEGQATADAERRDVSA